MRGRDGWKVAGALFITYCATSLTNLWADFPTPRFDRVHPLGLAAGSSVDVEVAGGELEGLRELRFDRPGLSAEPIAGKDRWFKITAAADVPPGTYDFRLVGRWGISNPKLIAVQRGLAEALDTEPNNDLTQAQQIELNTVVNGMSDGENVDIFRIAGKAGQRVVCDVDAQKLDSGLDSQLLLLTSSGKQLASSADYHGRDSLIDTVLPAAGDYFIVLHDLSYRGGFPYRLTVTTLPHVENVFPRAIQRGQAGEFLALGRNLGNTNLPPVAGEPPLEAVKFTLTAPNIPPGDYVFEEHPTDHSVLPTAASFTMSGFQVRPQMPAGVSLTCVPMLLVDTPVAQDIEPNDQQTSAQKISLPATISGRFEKRGDVDWFEFSVTEPGAHAFKVYSERIAGQADPYLVLTDDQGKRLGELDDYGHRMNAFDGHLRDPSGQFDLQKDKTYRVLVQDRYQRGGPRLQYVLTIARVETQIDVASIHREQQNPTALILNAGGSTWIDLVLNRDGPRVPVTITAENLPSGVHAAPILIPQEMRGAMVLWSDENAPPGLHDIRLFASYPIGDQTVKRELRYHTRVWNDKNSSRPMRTLPLSLLEAAPFSARVEKDRFEVEQGGSVQTKVMIKRLSPDFKSDVKLIPLSFPGNLQMPEVTISGGGNEAMITINTQKNLQPGEYSLVVQAQAQAPYQKDLKSPDKQNTLVTMPCPPIVVVVQPEKKS